MAKRHLKHDSVSYEINTRLSPLVQRTSSGTLWCLCRTLRIKQKISHKNFVKYSQRCDHDHVDNAILRLLTDDLLMSVLGSIEATEFLENATL